MSNKKNIDSKIRINKVYTKNGDKGKTSLIGNYVVDKDDLRIEAYGTVDELQAIIGACIVNVEKNVTDNDIINKTKAIYIRIQNELFNLGSLLSRIDYSDNSNIPMIKHNNIIQLENEIDEINKKLPDLTSFVLPGGSETNIFFHMARTICRRAERRCVSLSKKDEIDNTIVTYLNRLSDHLFVFSRWYAKVLNHPENLWDPNL